MNYGTHPWEKLIHYQHSLTRAAILNFWVLTPLRVAYQISSISDICFTIPNIKILVLKQQHSFVFGGHYPMTCIIGSQHQGGCESLLSSVGPSGIFPSSSAHLLCPCPSVFKKPYCCCIMGPASLLFLGDKISQWSPWPSGSSNLFLP